MSSTEKEHTPQHATCAQPAAPGDQAAHAHTPSLFPDEWHQRFDPELERLMADAPSSEHNALYARFLQTHPPLFRGLYCSPSIFLNGELSYPPRLSTRDNQLWIEAWSEPGLEPVLHVIPIAHHRLVALVLRHELIIICAHEYEHACHEQGAHDALAR
jgi:hypothetical protein